MCIGSVFHTISILRTILSDKFLAGIEHIITRLKIFCSPILIYINLLNIPTPCKHICQVFSILCIKASEVNRCYINTVIEHEIHTFNLLDIEVAEVEGCQVLTTIEHTLHTCHILCIEITQVKRC